MEIEPVFSCDACGLPRGPLSPIPGEGGPRHLCPACLHAFVAGEVSAMESRMGIKGGESMEEQEPDLTMAEAYQAARESDHVINPVTHYPDGTPRDWVTMELRAADYRTLNQLAETWQCSRDNALGMLCRAVRMQVWPLGDVLTSLPEFHAWVERLVRAEQGPLREAFRRANPEEQAAMDRELPHRGRRRALAAEGFCVRCHHLREGLSLDRADGLCEECGDDADA
jgi:hypothetical protein